MYKTTLIRLINFLSLNLRAKKGLRPNWYCSFAKVSMSTMIKKFSAVFACLAFILFFFSNISAQNTEIKITIPASKQPFARVEIKFAKPNPDRNISFLRNYADSENLGSRIKNLEIENDKNQAVNFNKFSDVDFQTSANYSFISYDLQIPVPENVLATAHVSWLCETHGLLMLNDLQPEPDEKTAAKISFDLPANWKISTSEKRIAEKTFQVVDVRNAVFLVGASWRQNTVSADDSILEFSAVGDWNFETSEAAALSAQILSEYKKIFGSIPEKHISVFLMPFPREIGFERWRAETRGATVSILSSRTAFKNLEIQRLHEQLRHELFHLWMPNKLNLSGDYAWFYEGFTQYAALRTGVSLNRITFQNFLNTLEQAIAFSNAGNQTISMIEASNQRWSGEDSAVYSKGMLIAFLCDTALLRQSRGKVDLFDVFRQVYQKHGFQSDRADGNSAILEILQSYNELKFIVENYVKGASRIDFERNLNETGFETAPSNYGQKLQIKAKLTSREKDLLDKLGYNNWRKALRNSK